MIAAWRKRSCARPSEGRKGWRAASDDEATYSRAGADWRGLVRRLGALVAAPSRYGFPDVSHVKGGAVDAATRDLRHRPAHSSA